MKIYFLDNEWLIDTDRYNWNVSRRKVAESGKNAGTVTYRDTTYYGTLPQAVAGLYRRAVKEVGSDVDADQFEQLNELTKRVEALQQDLLDTVTKACKEFDVTKERIHFGIQE